MPRSHLTDASPRAATKRGERPSKKTAITRTELDALLATCDDTLEGKRDRALLCFAFASGGRRRSEVATADLADLKVIDRGYIYHLPYSKTRQAGPSTRTRRISRCSVSPLSPCAPGSPPVA